MSPESHFFYSRSIKKNIYFCFLYLNYNLLSTSTMAETISTDYLVIGAGAMGMAFVDTLLSDTKATVVIVDRYDSPGGHWNVAYPFVHLHQPSSFYGVNSKKLGNDQMDKVGLNKGLLELATSQEVVGYYSQLMYQHFLPSGRVTYFPKCEYTGDGMFHSVVTAKSFQVGKETRIVDATFMKVRVPAMGPPAYEVASGVDLITPNELANITRAYGNYTVVGAGKTGIDTCLWLLGRGIEPSNISWIMPRDSWLLDREALQPGPKFSERRRQDQMARFQAAMSATSVDDLFKRLESAGHLMRLSDKVWPTMYRCATVSIPEFKQLGKIDSIIRMGRVIRVGDGEVKLQGGTYKAKPDTLYINCTADGAAKLLPVPVFNGNKITLQPVRTCQQVFSSAFIAHVEATYNDENLKNEMCRPIPLPYETVDWIKTAILNTGNRRIWNSKPATVAWLLQARLNLDMHNAPEDPAERAAVEKQKDEMGEAVAQRLMELVGTKGHAA